MTDDHSKQFAKHDQFSQPQDSSFYGNGATPMADTSSVDKLTVALDVRRRFIGLWTVASIATIVVITLFFHQGVELRTYHDVNMTQEERDDLLDKYNGYSGNVTSAIGRPLEMVISMMTQLLMLRFLAKALLEPEPKWHVAKIALALSTALGFFLNNGLSALNVQLRDRDVTPAMQASDLQTPQGLERMNASAVTNISQSFPETLVNNSIANTVLRNAVLPVVSKVPSRCEGATSENKIVDDTVFYGFQTNEWMQHVLPESLEAKKLRVVINATDPNANKNVNAANLPMRATVAADLFITAVMMSTQYVRWGKLSEWSETIKPEVFGSRTNGDSLPTAIAAGLLPPQEGSSEPEQRDYFLRASQSFFNNRRLMVSNISRSNVEMEFAHIDISPTITFDSLTWQVEVNASLLSSVEFSNNNTRYGDARCGPWPGICAIPRLDEDPQMVVHAFAACANEDGTETLVSRPKSGQMIDFYIECPRKSNSSLILLSTGRRNVADGFLDKTAVSGSRLVPDSLRAVSVNPRKFYSFTVGRLSWKAEDLAVKYKATCDAPGQCTGIDLATTNDKSLLAGVDTVPLGLVQTLRYGIATENRVLSPHRVVTVTEPPMKTSLQEYPFYDYVLPHNIRAVSTNRTQKEGRECYIPDEERMQNVFNHHMYVESTLQPTYTAGIFFLFQNAALRDGITMSDGKKTLAFDGNKVNFALWVSIPTWNAGLTGAGCLLLLIGFLSAMFWDSTTSGTASDSMKAITTPHVIARVMLDDNSFPPSVVHRRIVNDPTMSAFPSDKNAPLVDDFLIESLRLKCRNANQDTAAAGFV